MRELLRLEGERNRRRVEESIYWYGWPADKADWPNYGKPNPIQDQFHRSKAPIRLFMGGNRTGKSHGGISEDSAYLLGERLWLPEGDPDRKVDVKIPSKVLICGESFGEQVKKVLVPKMIGDVEHEESHGILPAKFIDKVKRNERGIVNRVVCKNGSIADFMSYDQDKKVWESTDHDAIHFDEPPPRHLFVAAYRGLTDRSGDCWFTMTPLKEAWIYDTFIAGEGDLDIEGDVDAYVCDIRDNVDYGLTEKGVEQFEKILDPDEREMRLHGRFFHLIGMVYKEWQVSRHCLPRFKTSSQYGHWMHIDYHPRKPHHAVWMAIRPDGVKFVIGELVNKDSANRIKPFCQEILEYEREFLGIERGWEPVERLIDPLSKMPNPSNDGRGAIDDFAECGVECRAGSKDRKRAITKMHDHLCYEPDRGVYPMLYVFDDLKQVKYEIGHYQWDEESGPSAGKKEPKEEPIKKNDDLLEGIHRILLDDPYAPEMLDPEDEGHYGNPQSTGYSDGY